MANTYTQMNVHAVFSVKGRGNFISKNWSDELHKYIAGTLKETKNYSLAVGGCKDHVHINILKMSIWNYCAEMK